MVDDRFTSPFPPPEGDERELLTIAWEEANEVGVRISKALRFGLKEIEPGQLMTNAERIAAEVGDFVCVIDKLIALGVLNSQEIDNGWRKKTEKLKRYLQTVPRESNEAAPG